MSYIPPVWEWQMLEVLASCGFVAFLTIFYLLWCIFDLEARLKEIERCLA